MVKKTLVASLLFAASVNSTECGATMNTGCKQSCPSGNAKGKWVQYGTFNHGCCASFSSCGGHSKRCRFECNDSSDDDAPQSGPFYFKSGDCSALQLTGKCVETKGDRYPNNVKCTIGVREPTDFETERFAIEKHHSCGWDSLQINGKKYCGSEKPSVTQASTDIVFSTDYSVTDRGFRLCEKASSPAQPPSTGPKCGATMDTACKGSCPSGNGNGNWVQYETFGWGCCASFGSCGGHRKRCRFECNTRRLEDTDSLEAPRLAERLLKLAA